MDRARVIISSFERPKVQMEKEVDEISRRCGGPAQYLQRLGQAELNEFAKY